MPAAGAGVSPDTRPSASHSVNCFSQVNRLRIGRPTCPGLAVVSRGNVWRQTGDEVKRPGVSMRPLARLPGCAIAAP